VDAGSDAADHLLVRTIPVSTRERVRRGPFDTRSGVLSRAANEGPGRCQARRVNPYPPAKSSYGPSCTDGAAGRHRPAVALSLALSVLAVLLLVCGASAARADSVDPPDPAAQLRHAQIQAAERFAGGDGTFAPRGLLVEHTGGRLERIVLLLARRPDGATSLVDPTGRLYAGGLDDFRSHNHLLTSDDTMVAFRDITEPSPHTMVTASGHTRPDRTLWLVAGICGGAAVVLTGPLVLFRRARRKRPGPPGAEIA
jgi:hypothetical protein